MTLFPFQHAVRNVVKKGVIEDYMTVLTIEANNPVWTNMKRSHAPPLRYVVVVKSHRLSYLGSFSSLFSNATYMRKSCAMTNSICKRVTSHIGGTVGPLMRTYSSHAMATALIFTDTKQVMDMDQLLSEVWKTLTKNR